MLIRTALVSAAAFTTTACVTATEPPRDCEGIECVALDEEFEAGAVAVTPIEVLEDSRCPINARCVWAGQVRIRAQVERGGQETLVELTSGEALPVYSGSLTLSQVWPAVTTQEQISGPEAYRFHFTWTPHMLDTQQ